ncbi:NPC1-like intracellular cholesterol transporter 1-like, partial [Homarus americanus]
MGKSDRNCLAAVSDAVAGSLEKFFYRYGKSVATHPKKYIAACFLITAFCCLGFFNFYAENRPEKLWIPQDSDYVNTLNWQAVNFPNNQRVELTLYEADNVLTARYIQEMYRQQKAVHDITVTDKYNRSLTQDNLCFRVPALGGEMHQELRNVKAQLFPDRDLDSELDWSIAFDKGIYYQFYEKMPTACLELSILDIWGKNQTIIYSLTDEDVINGINTANISAMYSYPINFKKFLGDIKKNTTGHVVGARSSLAQIVMEINRTEIDLVKLANDAGLAEEVDMALYDWEGEFIRVLRNDSGRPEGLGVFLQAQRSFGEISGETILGDVAFLVVGMILLFVYVQLMLGKFNMVENRPVLSVLGLMSIFMAVGISFGLCSAFGIPYGPVHSILPLLMLGLGVDDMFVIVQCWHNLNQEERRLDLHKRMGCALRHAGVAITVTSLTDFAAFAIGSSTVLPALRSFCIYSALGIVALFMLQATFFVAWFTLDQTRLEDNRNGLLWCYKHKNWTPNKCSQYDLCQMFFDKIYPKYLLMTPVKMVVLLMTVGVFATSIWGVTNLRQEFNPVWFIPQSSYLFQFLYRAQEYYPDADINGKSMNETFFSAALSAFLYSPVGSRFQTYFNFDGNLTIAQPAPPVTVRLII